MPLECIGFEFYSLMNNASKSTEALCVIRERTLLLLLFSTEIQNDSVVIVFF